MTDIIPISDEERATWPKSVLVDLPSSYDDSRGSIQPLVDVNMKSSVLIDSNSGAVRANHYHKTDWHYCYIISGKIEYFHKKVDSPKKPELIIAKKGEMIFTPPLVEHCMKFPEDTIFLTLSRNSRDQETYEADVVRVNLIDTKGSISWLPNEQ